MQADRSARRLAATCRSSATGCVGMLALALASITGCGESGVMEVSRLSPVSGKLVVHGRPAQDAVVTLHPLDQQGAVLTKGAVGVGVVQADGSFQVRTYQPGDGVKAGEYAVTVQWLEPAPAGASPDQTGRDRLSNRFRDPKKPLAKVSVKDGANVLDPFQID